MRTGFDLLVLALFFAASASALTTISSLPYVASTAGETYNLSGNLSSAGDGVIINASNVVLDCGANLSGANTGAGVIVNGSATGVSITNCVIDSFETGVLVNTTGSAVSVLATNFSNLRSSTGNAFGINAITSTIVTVSNTVFSNVFAGTSGGAGAGGGSGFGINASNAFISNTVITGVFGSDGLTGSFPSGQGGAGGWAYGIVLLNGSITDSSISNLRGANIGPSYSGTPAVGSGIGIQGKNTVLTNVNVSGVLSGDSGYAGGNSIYGVYSTNAVGNKNLINNVWVKNVSSTIVAEVGTYFNHLFSSDVLNLNSSDASITTPISFNSNTTLVGGCNVLGTITDTGVANGFFSTCQRIEVRAFNELNASQYLTHSVSAFNGTDSVSNNSAGITCLAGSIVPNFVVTATVSNTTSYYARNYIFPAFGPNSTWVFDAFLLPTSDSNALFVRFNIKSSGGSPVAGATISVSKYFGSALTVVGQGVTDSVGITSFYLDSLTPYTIVASATGYNSSTISITPSVNDYTMFLAPVLGGGMNASFNDVYFSLAPLLFNNGINLVNYSVVSTDSQLALYWLNVWYNGSILYSNNGSNPGGGSIAVNVNASGKTKDLVLEVNFTKTSGYGYWGNRSYNLSSSVAAINNSWFRVLTDVPAQANSQLGTGLFALIIIALASAYATRMGAPIGGGIVGLVFTVIFGAFSWLPWTTSLICIVSYVSLLITSRS